MMRYQKRIQSNQLKSTIYKIYKKDKYGNKNQIWIIATIYEVYIVILKGK